MTDENKQASTGDRRDPAADPFRTVSEQVEVVGGQLVDRVRDLIAQGNVRRLIFRAPDGKVVLEMTLTAGTVMGGAIVLSAWWLAAVGAIAAAFARIRIEIIRDIDEPDVVAGKASPVEPARPERPASTGKQKVRIEVED
jgi:hypothetical protein